jgi:hypothetical protein
MPASIAATWPGLQAVQLKSAPISHQNSAAHGPVHIRYWATNPVYPNDSWLKEIWSALNLLPRSEKRHPRLRSGAFIRSSTLDLGHWPPKTGASKDDFLILSGSSRVAPLGKRSNLALCSPRNSQYVGGLERNTAATSLAPSLLQSKSQTFDGLFSVTYEAQRFGFIPKNGSFTSSQS